MAKAYIKIGRILKPTGTSGELKIELQDDFVDDFLGSDHFFIFERGTYVPYFIEQVRENNGVLIKIEDVHDPETALDFNLKHIFLPESNISSTSYSSQKEKEQLEGFSIIENEIEIGLISEIAYFPHQIMAVVLIGEKEVYIPLVDEFIVNIDMNKKEVSMTLPEGILDL